jgi:uncharacterized protein with NRDE domain
MCLVALFFRMVPDAPIIVGANREEAYRRGGTPPQILEGPIRAAGGVDPVGGGTWLGVNANGLLVAVTNRRKSVVPESPPSRGMLVRRLLGCSSAGAAIDEAVRELTKTPYAGANFVIVDPKQAHVIEAGDWLRSRPLPPGLHVLSNRDVNDGSDPRVRHVHEWLGGRNLFRGSECIEALREVCSHAEPDNAPVCFRTPTRGTVSGSILALRAGKKPDTVDLAQSVYLHAQGAPCETPYEDYSDLLKQLS